jgi:hypothetical protein
MVGVLTLCRGDVNVPGRAVAVRVPQGGDLCYLGFSNHNVLAGADNDELYSSKVTNVSALVAAFDAAVAALLNATDDSIKRFATRRRRQEGACPRSTPGMSQAGCRSCLANVIQMAHNVLQQEVHRHAVQLPVGAEPVLRRHPTAPAPGASVIVGSTSTKEDWSTKEKWKAKMCGIRFTNVARSNW